MNLPSQEKATYVSVAAPVVAMGIMCCTNPVPGMRDVDVSYAVAQLAILAVFAIFGLGCGVYGVVTFGDHGSYGIIVGCVLGVLLNGALLTLVALAVLGPLFHAAGA